MRCFLFVDVAIAIGREIALLKQSKQLLEIAKTGVEKAIEENEERAIDWIEQELKKLNINLSNSLENHESN